MAKTFCALTRDGTDSNPNRSASKPSSSGWLITVPPGYLEISERHQSFKHHGPTAVEDITYGYYFRILLKNVCVYRESVRV